MYLPDNVECEFFFAVIYHLDNWTALSSLKHNLAKCKHVKYTYEKKYTYVQFSQIEHFLRHT